MPERYLGQLKPDMEVCDLTGEKVGTISHIYRHAEAAVSADGGATPPAAEPATPTYDDEVIEVKTGFLGLGSHLYIPIDAVQDVLTESVFLSKPKEAFEQLGWHDKPQHLDQLE